MSRRRVLGALGGGLLALAGCGGGRGSPTGPRGVADERLGFNVHPLFGVEALQRQALRLLGTTWIRVTLGLAMDAQAQPYVGTVPNVLGIAADFLPGPLDPAQWPALLEGTLRRYPTARLVQLLNEPDSFNGLSAERYVQDFLRPGYELIRARFPGVSVVAAAPVGTRAFGPDRFRRMTDAGADEVCDYRAIHVYFEDDAALGAVAAATGRPILVTETGTAVASQQVRWYSDVVPRIRSALGAAVVFWYVLLESGSAYPGHSLIANAPGPDGQPQAAPGSGLYPLLVSGGRASLRRR